MYAEFLRLAIRNIGHRKKRAWLTMIGIFIGIAAVVALISLGSGLSGAIEEQFKALGTDKITIMGKVGTISGPAASSMSTRPLTTDDEDRINSVKGVDYTVSFIVTSATVEYRGENENLMISGIPPDKTNMLFEDMERYSIYKGRYITDNDRYNVNIGYNVAYKLFENDMSVRSRIKVNGVDFKVVGILEKVGNTFDDESIIGNADVIKQFLPNPKVLSIILVKVKPGFDPSNVAEDIEKKLRRYRNEKEGEELFTVQTSEDLLETLGTILGMVSGVIIGIAGISLLVGGIGIMNTMYTAVLERTKEIGIMKAIGARRKHILTIFLIESGLLGLLGGLIGTAIGISLSYTAARYVQESYGVTFFKASFAPELILGALAFSFIIGTLSGALPARQAASLKPVDALRYE